MAIQTRTYLKTKFEAGDKPTQQDFYDLLDSVRLKSESVPVSSVTYGMLALSISAGTISWDVSQNGNAYVTLTSNATLSLSNLQAGQLLLLKVKQDGTGGRTLTLPAGSKVGYGGAGVIALSSAANAVDIVTIFADESSVLHVLINQNFT